MPIYEYECTKCLWRFEVQRHFGEDGASPCPKCGHEVRRIYSPAAIIFKGSGFYITDSRKKSGQGAEEAGSSKGDKDIEK